jgi:hypothetical protein
MTSNANPETIKTPSLRRRQLLPHSFVFFSWLLMHYALVTLISIPLSLMGTPALYSLYGLSTSSAFTQSAILIVTLILLKGMVGWAFWYEKSWALVLATVDFILGMIICLALFLWPFPLASDFWVRPELFLLLPYGICSLKNQTLWKSTSAKSAL